MKHFVYIIGAGLTKALESSNRIPLMWDFVSVMAEYIWQSDGSYDRTILTTLAELENSGLFENTKPEWKELARRVTDFVNDKAELTDGDAASFKRVMQTRQPVNIEELLEKSLRKGTEELGSGFIPQRFNFAINRMFARIGWNANLFCLERFLDAQLKLPDTRHTFVSFNYDLILDCCIQQQRVLPWEVKSGYGFSAERFITPVGGSEHMKQFEKPVGHFGLMKSNQLEAQIGSENALTLLKPHGSLNWILGFEGSYEFLNAIPVLCLNDNHSIVYYDRFTCDELQLKDEIGWDLSQENVWTGAGLFLIPPADAKTSGLDFVKSIRAQEEEAYLAADEIYVIGWSMPPTDGTQVELISKCMEKREHPGNQVTVVNYKADAGYYDRVAQVFGLERDKLFVNDSGFCEYAERG